MGLSRLDDWDSGVEPIDMIEHIADLNDWIFERVSSDEISIIHVGRWATYTVAFSWYAEMEALQVVTSFDMRVPETRIYETTNLLARINEQLWMGHFDVWQQHGAVIYRQSLLLSGGAVMTTRQIEKMMNGAIETVECYYPAFQYVAWGGQTTVEALKAVMYVTEGDA